jgi:3',5'-cyclic-AMP phosphodiesterase
MNRRNLLKTSGIGLASLALPSLPTPAQALSPTPQRQLRLAHVTDVHMQGVVGAAKGFARCLQHAQNLPDPPDLLINGGDAIMEAHGRGRGSVERQWSLYNSVMAEANSLPVLNCLGNHDIWCCEETPKALADGKRWAMDNLQMSQPYYSLDKNGWHIVVLDSIQANAEGRWYTAHLDEAQFDWLKRDLAATPATTPTLIVSHVPILAACVFFDGKRYENQTWNVPGRWMHTDARQLVELFDRHPNVKACISGHIHLTDRVDYNGVSYFCNGAVSGAWWFGKYQHTPPGYALIDLYSDGTVQNTYGEY